MGVLLSAGIFHAVALTVPSPPSTNLLVQWHFAGANAVSADKSGAGAQWQVFEAREMRRLAVERLGTQLNRLLLSDGFQTNPAVTAAATKWIERLWSAESTGQVYRDGQTVSGWQIAALLSDTDHSDLTASISIVATEWSLAPVAGSQAWTVSPSLRLQLARTNGWSVLSLLKPESKERTAFLKQFGTKSPVLGAQWLKVTLGFQAMKPWWNVPAPLNTAVVQLSAGPKGKDISTVAQITFTQPQPVKTVAWQVPTNTIRDPLISFTALQGAALNWFDTAWIGDWKPPVKPDQMYLWAMDNIPFLSFAALHVPNSKEFLTKTEKDWLAVNPLLQSNRLGLVRSQTNGVGLVWNQLPIIVPTLKPAADPDGDYLLGGLFPPPPSTNNIPGELLQQFVPRTNLVYYDWEVTAPRVQQWQNLAPILNMITSKVPVRGSNAGQTWIKAVGPKLGNAVTEATVVNTREITIVRRSTLGLTGYELNRLVRWFDNPGFPFAEVYQTPLPMVAPPGIRK